MKNNEIATIILNDNGDVAYWEIDDNWFEDLKLELDMPDITKEQVLAIMLKNKDKAEITDCRGHLIRPLNAIIN